MAQNMENGWQFSKLYACHIGPDGNPTPEYFQWAAAGWQATWAQRYPMGKGVKHECSWWAGEKLTYLEARKRIYLPLYTEAVLKTEAWKKLLTLYRIDGQVTLWDFDGYDFHALGMTFREVAECPTRKMGHALVLAALLEKLA